MLGPTRAPEQGQRMREKLVVPRLRVRKRWFEGLNPDPIDHTHPDAGNNADAQFSFAGNGQVGCTRPFAMPDS